jgi:hypothetical protein
MYRPSPPRSCGKARETGVISALALGLLGAITPRGGWTPIDLTEEDFQLLKQLAAAGERGGTVIAPMSRGGLRKLVRAGYVVDRAVSMNAVLYIITLRGRKTLADAV